MTQLDLGHERQIEITQVSEEVPVVVLHELGRMFSQELKPAPLIEEITGPLAIERPGLRKRIHTVITPNRHGAPFSADEVEPESRGHKGYAAGVIVGYLPKEKPVHTNSDDLRDLNQRQRKTTRKSGFHF